MENAKETVRRTLEQAKAFLAQEAAPRINEADTRAFFIDPLVRALGWDGIGVVSREYHVRSSGEYIDYVLNGPGGRLLAVEAESFHTDLTDKHAAQLVQYCAVEGIEWAALTNGRELQFFNRYLKGDITEQRIFKLNMLAFGSDEEFEDTYELIRQLSRGYLTEPTGTQLWLRQRRVGAWLLGQLLAADAPTVQYLRQAMSQEGLEATPQEIVEWFRVHLSTATGGSTKQSGPAPRGTTTTTTTPAPTVAISTTAKPLPQSGNRMYLLTPIKGDARGSVQDILDRLIGQGWYVFGEKTPGRKALKPGDWICFYEKGVGVVAEAEVASMPERKRLDFVAELERFPWAFQVRNVRYFYDAPVALDASLRAQLSGFSGKDAAGAWSWYVQQTHTVTEQDFALLTRRTRG